MEDIDCSLVTSPYFFWRCSVFCRQSQLKVVSRVIYCNLELLPPNQIAINHFTTFTETVDKMPPA